MIYGPVGLSGNGLPSEQHCHQQGGCDWSAVI